MLWQAVIESWICRPVFLTHIIYTWSDWNGGHWNPMYWADPLLLHVLATISVTKRCPPTSHLSRVLLGFRVPSYAHDHGDWNLVIKSWTRFAFRKPLAMFKSLQSNFRGEKMKGFFLLIETRHKLTPEPYIVKLAIWSFAVAWGLHKEAPNTTRWTWWDFLLQHYFGEFWIMDLWFFDVLALLLHGKDASLIFIAID